MTGLGTGTQATADANTPPALSFWTQGGYWDLTQIAGFNGDPMPGAPVPSAIGVNVLTVVNAPLIQDSAIAGLRAMACDSVALSHFQCNVLASRIAPGLVWSMVVEGCATGNSLPVPVFCAGSSADAVHNYFRAEQLNGTQFLTLFQDTVANGPRTTNVPTNLQFNPFVLVLRSDGVTVTGSINNGPIFSLGPIDPALACDRLAWGAIVSTAIAQGGDVLFTTIGFSFSFITDRQMVGLTLQLQAAHKTVPPGVGPYFCPSGDSETQGDSGNNAGGWRQPDGVWIQACGMSVYPWGPSQQGVFQYREHAAQGGARCSVVASIFTTALGSLAGVPALVENMMGTNNLSAIDFPSSLPEYQAGAVSMATALLARNPNAKIALTLLLAIDPTDTPFSANAEAFNAGLISTVWPALEALFPGVFIYLGMPNAWNPRTSIPAFDPALYLNAAHLNTAGYDVEGQDRILTWGKLLRALSPTLNPFAVHISSPAPGAVLHVGVPTTIKIGATRYPYSNVTKFNGVGIGSATPNPKSVLGQLVFTPVGGQVGPGVLTVDATDTLDPSTTATSAGVAITIAP